MDEFQQFNCGERFGVKFVIGLYHPKSVALSAHGAYVVAKLHGENMMRMCTFHDGISFPALCICDDVKRQVLKLLEEGWKWMSPSDVYVCCCGMSHPGPDEPFWSPGSISPCKT